MSEENNDEHLKAICYRDQPLACPLFTSAAAIVNGVAQAMEAKDVKAKIIDPYQKAAAGQISLSVQAIPCIGDKCAFFHVGSKRCGIAAAPEALDIIGGAVFNKFNISPNG